MSDVFISYSRKDSEFVRKLHDGLVAAGSDTWVDWQRIQVSNQWWNEITVAINEANTFVFVVTQASLSSKICNQELAHALKQHKRIIPILREDIDEKSVLAEKHIRSKTMLNHVQ